GARASRIRPRRAGPPRSALPEAGIAQGPRCNQNRRLQTGRGEGLQMTSEEELFRELQKEPPLPPWIAFPALERYSIGWRMGYGETHLFNLYVYFKCCSQGERESYVDKYPEPAGWEGWYSDRDR